MTHPSARKLRAGTTFVELAICTLLVGVVLVASLDTAGSAARSAVGLKSQNRVQLYTAKLMSEIMAAPYYDPEAADVDENFGIESGENSSPPNRLGFDDMDDYDDWTESSALQDRDGAANANSTGWSRTVDIVKLSAMSPQTALANNALDQGARRITVTVTSPSGDTTSLQAIRSLDGAVEQPLGVDATLVTGVRMRLSTTNIDTNQRSAINNHASGP